MGWWPLEAGVSHVLVPCCRELRSSACVRSSRVWVAVFLGKCARLTDGHFAPRASEQELAFDVTVVDTLIVPDEPQEIQVRASVVVRTAVVRVMSSACLLRCRRALHVLRRMPLKTVSVYPKQNGTQT